jgi:DNA-binding MarR family transcriptional regulator
MIMHERRTEPSATARPAPARGRGKPPARTGVLPQGCTSFKLRQLSRRVSQHFDRVVGLAGLKTTQYSLLSHIVKLGPMRPGALAASMEMDASTLTRNLQPLVAQGWVVVDPGDDGRSRVVGVTEAGRDKRAEAQREWKRAQVSLNERLGAGRVDALHTLIDDCLALMREGAAD